MINGGNMEDKTDFIKILKHLKSNWLFLCLSFLGPALLAMVISLLIPKSYTSSVTMLAPEVSAGGSISSNPFGLLSNLGLKSKGLSTQALIATLKSDFMTSDIVDSFDIQKMYKIKKKREAMQFLNNNLTKISINNIDGTISISVTTHSPKMSFSIANYYIYNLYKINNILNLTTQQPIVRIMNPPYIPEKKTAPKVKFNMIIAGILGLLFGFTFIYIKLKLINGN
jgi:capsular polysaccharide biosynthesis protein